MKLKHDIVSMFRGLVYARAGEEVELIATHGNILIVESKAGTRFSIYKTDLTENYIKQQEPVRIPVENKPMKQQPAKRKAAVINKQQTLF